jgi:hypothetical protein
MVHFTTDCCRVESRENILLQYWEGTFSDDQFRYAVIKTLDLIKEHSFKALILDTQGSQGFTMQLIDWLKHEINPKLISYGLTKMAIIAPEHFVTRMETDIIQHVGKKQSLKIEYFYREEDALVWASL